MKHVLIAALFLTSPAFAGGIDEQVYPPDTMPAAEWKKIEAAHESGRTVTITKDDPNPTDPGKTPVTPAPAKPKTKAQRNAEKWGTANLAEIRRNNPAGYAQIVAEADKRTAEAKRDPKNDRDGDGKVSGKEARAAALGGDWSDAYK